MSEGSAGLLEFILSWATKLLDMRAYRQSFQSALGLVIQFYAGEARAGKLDVVVMPMLP